VRGGAGRRGRPIPPPLGCPRGYRDRARGLHTTDRRVRIEFAEDRLRMETEFFRGEGAWTELDDVVVFAGFWVLRLSNGGQVVIPGSLVSPELEAFIRAKAPAGDGACFSGAEDERSWILKLLPEAEAKPKESVLILGGIGLATDAVVRRGDRGHADQAGKENDQREMAYQISPVPVIVRVEAGRATHKGVELARKSRWRPTK